MHTDARWKQRFDNFNRAKSQLDAAITATTSDPDNKLYRIALVGAFEFTYELGWKTLKDYLFYQGIETTLPRDVMRHAFQHQLISDGQCWIDMMEDRNILVHVYDEARAIEASHIIQTCYVHAFNQLAETLSSKAVT